MELNLNEDQQNRVIEIMNKYLKAPGESKDKTFVQEDNELDKNRNNIIEQELKPLLNNFFNNNIQLPDFKSKIDSINKRNELWGFKGIKGQMFFNMVLNAADDLDECEQEIKMAIKIPENEQIASSRIKTFESYIKRISNELLESGGSKYKTPKVGSLPYFSSYFWQIQDNKTWPIYYTNNTNVMKDLNLWQQTGNLSEDYIRFKHIIEELMDIFTRSSGKKFGLYDVEHVFWYHGGIPYESSKSSTVKDEEKEKMIESSIEIKFEDILTLPESYVPPVVAILPKMAQNEPKLEEIAKKSGIQLPNAFEKYVNSAFTILGYETTPLGQGLGRVPDGVAIDHDNSYAIIWDAKVRTDGYSMGTDDRTIREYISTQSRELKRRRRFRNIYYVIVSSKFTEDYDDSISNLKMDTDVNEVILLEADALVEIINAKLRDPLQITLGSDGIQRLFTNSRVLTAKKVRESLM
jgi:hypothetical protein